jgi:DNA-directed RNA polymerase specialized sigma24 family protein
MSEVPSRTNKTSDKVGDNAILMADLSKEYEQRWIIAEQERLSLIDSINQIEEPYRTILFMRYVEDMSLEAIAAQLNYSYSIVAHMHGDALQMYERGNENANSSTN